MEGGVEADESKHLYRLEAPGILHLLYKYPILRAQKLMNVKPNICKKAGSICSKHDHWIYSKSLVFCFFKLMAIYTAPLPLFK